MVESAKIAKRHRLRVIETARSDSARPSTPSRRGSSATWPTSASADEALGRAGRRGIILTDNAQVADVCEPASLGRGRPGPLYRGEPRLSAHTVLAAPSCAATAPLPHGHCAQSNCATAAVANLQAASGHSASCAKATATCSHYTVRTPTAMPCAITLRKPGSRRDPPPLTMNDQPAFQGGRYAGSPESGRVRPEIAYDRRCTRN